MTLVEAHIADIHFGAIEPNLQYKILQEQFLQHLHELQVLDIISINGDLFDHRFLASSDAIMYASMFIQELIEIAKEKNATLILISGTASHDADQLKLFYHYIGEEVDIRIIEEVKFIEVKGKTILCIPELYNMGEDYYKQFLYSRTYDACYLHGTYLNSIFGKSVPDLASDREPVFHMDHFACCRGPIIAGHVHTPQVFDKHFYYCGSPYRWMFGQEEEKGFIILIHNLIQRDYYVHFEPIKSFRYDTINLDNMLHSDPQKVIEYIKKKKAEGIDNIRIKFTEYDDTNIPIIKSYFRNVPGVKIDALYKNAKVVEEVEKLNQSYQEYDYIFDKSASPYDILSKYINQKENQTFITADGLIELLSEEI